MPLRGTDSADPHRRDQQLFGDSAVPVPYRMGWELAVEEINAAGGLLGRKVEIIDRDDGWQAR